MASISSTNSSSSLGNTSLRGFGGMVSGIDRDSIVEQMTLGTTTKDQQSEEGYDTASVEAGGVQRGQR